MTDTTKLKQRIEQWIAELQRGELTEQSLRQGLEEIDAPPSRCQDLLYLQAGGTSVGSRVVGMALIRNGQFVEPPTDPEDWPYKSTLEAIRDGWRVIQFPNLALMMDNRRTYGLGCEFILERWS